MYIKRIIEKRILKYFSNIPVTAITGARQVGKSTLAKQLLKGKNDVVYLDVEKPSDRQILENADMFFEMNSSKVICIDEIQLAPELFGQIRSFVDDNPKSKIIILGSSSPDLLRKTSETLAGRVFYYELSPFLFSEVSGLYSLQKYRLRGGLPLSLLSENDDLAFFWLENYIKTFLERDLRMFGFDIPPFTIRRLWEMLAHLNGQVLNYSQLANSMGISQPTVKRYVDILHYTFMIRILPPYFINIKKRLIKSPKIFFRDTGVLHSLLNITNYNDLLRHPVYGTSWEVTVIENLINHFTGWQYFFYRTAKGVEIDLILKKGNRLIAIEIKSSTTPQVNRGFWTAIKDIGATEAFVIAPVKMSYCLKDNVFVYPLGEFLSKYS